MNRSRCSGNLSRDEADVYSLATRILAEREADRSDDYAALLDSFFHSASGIEDGRPLHVEVISPSTDPLEAVPPSEQFAWAFLFQFGGPSDLRSRQNDFSLGYRNMTYWLEHRLREYLPHADLSEALKTVNERYQRIKWKDVRCGGTHLSALSFGERVELGPLGHPVDHLRTHDLLHEGA
jgi:hypothetical protein